MPTPCASPQAIEAERAELEEERAAVGVARSAVDQVREESSAEHFAWMSDKVRPELQLVCIPSQKGNVAPFSAAEWPLAGAGQESRAQSLWVRWYCVPTIRG